MTRLLIALVAALTLTACATPPVISANPVQTAVNTVAATPLGGTVVTGLQNAEWNLDQAITIGVLPKTDPADACVHATLVSIGQEVGQPPVQAKQFQPKVTDLLSAGSVAYILAYQAKQLAGNGGIAIPPTCEQIVGEFVIKGVNAPANAVINGVLGVVP